MTWTLRLYDSDGTEIGWVTAGPYEYAITHPSPDDWWGVKASLAGWREPKGEAVPEDYATPGARYQFDNVADLDPTPEEHLGMVEEALLYSAVDSTALSEE